MSEVELTDAILRHALDLQRLSASDEAQAVEILNQLEDELKALLNSQTLSEAGKRQINALIAQADDAIAAHYANVAGVVDTKGLMRVVAENTTNAMQGLGSITRVTAERLASLGTAILIDGAPTAAWWVKQSEDAQFRFAQAVRQGIINGETQAQIVARVAGKHGFMEIARHNARSLVHSSVMTAANEARWETFKANADQADGVRWLATLDSHTCKTCAALDGAQWDFDKQPIPPSKMRFQGLPPRHFACRCVITLIPKSLDAILGTTGLDKMADDLSGRASANGVVSGKTTFADFLKRQSPAFVEDVLGKRRADMYLAGKITLRDLVSGTGRPLTLDELKSRQ